MSFSHILFYYVLIVYVLSCLRTCAYFKELYIGLFNGSISRYQNRLTEQSFDTNYENIYDNSLYAIYLIYICYFYVLF